MPELFGRNWSRRELSRRVGRLSQVAGVRLVTLGDGGARGVRVVEFRTGTGFGFDVVVDRALDIGACELRGIPLAWHSAVGVEGPWYHEPAGLGFFRTFGGGLLTTCGIEHALFMAKDTAEQYAYPPKAEEEFGLHGRVSNRPGRLIGYGERWDGDECTLWCEGEVQVATVFGEQLLLRRRIDARVGESRLRIHDTIENVGHDPTPHMLLYHVNAGFPLLDEGAELLVAASGVEPRGAHAVEGYTCIAPPAPGFVEEVFEHDLHGVGEPGGWVPAGVVNRRLGVGLYEVWRKDQLPHHFAWRMLRDGTYVVGIEPCTNRTGGRIAARERGELIVLQAGETREYQLELGALDGTGEIDAFAERVARATWPGAGGIPDGGAGPDADVRPGAGGAA